VASVTLEAVSKRFDGTLAVDGVSLAVADRAFLVLLGREGCGKTTLLRLVAGLEVPDIGTVTFGDRLVSRPGWALPPSERRVGMMFQSYALWPHMTVAQNVAFSLRVRKVVETERILRLDETLARFGLEALAERYPNCRGAAPAVALARCRPCARMWCCSMSRSPI
jgi:iron(III) transport system ATP-binding protein